MKKIVAFMLMAILLCMPALAIDTLKDDDISIEVPSAVLMEKSTGSLIYEKNAHEHMSPASVTKVMTLLLVMEAMDDGLLAKDDMVTASSYAAGMGGSQIWLEEGEQMSVHEMLKCVAVVSANDCAVALAEHIAGSEEAFVARMNARAQELGMADTHFTNCTGLTDDDDHYTCAYDVALMSRELISHDEIKEYTTIWMDTVRDGQFGLSNTNKLIYYYSGATGLKTGFTSKAMYCLSASAMRDGVEYIAVVMHGQTSDQRFDSAKTLLNYAFANYALVDLRPGSALPPVPVTLGKCDSVQPIYANDGLSVLTEKAKASDVEYNIELCEGLTAPVEAGQELGSITVTAKGETLAVVPLIAEDSVERQSVWNVFCDLIMTLICRK